MTNRTTALLLTVALALGAAACADGNDAASPAATSAPPEPAGSEARPSPPVSSASSASSATSTSPPRAAAMDWVDAAAYRSATVDPVLPHRHGIATHMHDDHAESGILLCERALGVAVASATFRHVDRLGCEYVARVGDELASVRLPFSTVATSSEDVRRLVVELVQAARAT